MSKLMQLARTAEAPNAAEPERIKAELDAVRATHSQMWNIERIAKEELDVKAHRLAWDLKLQGTGYRRLSLEPLGWTRGLNRWSAPVFAVYSLANPVMTIRDPRSVDRNNGHFLDSGGPRSFERQNPSHLPEAIQECFRPVHRQLKGRIRSTFSGVMPKEVRADIAKAAPIFTRDGMERPDIFIIAEGNWIQDDEPFVRPRNLDPLVTGWDGRSLWLITSFDLTDVERYMMAEFPELSTPGPIGLPEHRNGV